VRNPRLGAFLLLLSHAAALPATAAPAPDCTTQAAALSNEEAELPRLDIATPADRPPYCITLETVMAFVGRLKAHVASCPQSTHGPALAEWDRMRASYAKLFTQYRCRRTLG
jgi:hypothetical protein